jgi:maleylpyruvate isomerase
VTMAGFDSADPAGAAATLRKTVDAATELLHRSAALLSDQQAREPSLLSGWSRGHLLTHVARNADSLRNLLVWARTGVETPQYGHSGERAEGIAAGAGRSSAELLADLEASAAALDAEAARLPDTAWAAEVGGPPAHPAWFTLWRRLAEVEFHHVDLGVGYAAADWPEPFATYALAKVAADFTGPDCPAVLLQSSDAPVVAQIGPIEEQPAHMVTVTGPVRLLLAWLTGRSSGEGLTTEPPGPLPALPAWK